MLELNLKKQNMVDYQLKARGISDEKLLNAFLTVDRHLFVRSFDKDYSYEDYPLDIGYGQTISQPYIIALSLEKIDIKNTDSVLEIGTGSGYQTALLSKLAQKVYTVEIIPELHDHAKSLLSSLGYHNIEFILGDGYEGYPRGAPYDKIVVSCAAMKMPNKLVEQLKIGGKMVIPIESVFWQNLYLVIKEEDTINKTNLCCVRFVPMVEK